MRLAIKISGLVFVLALSACGGDGGERGGRFVGTWRSTAGTSTTLCPGYAPSTEPVNANLVWSPGIASDLVATDAAGCVTEADVSGSTATGRSGQTCTGSDGAGAVYTVSLSGYTFTIAPDGRTATENSSGTLTVVVQGGTVVCSVSATVSYQKISN